MWRVTRFRNTHAFFLTLVLLVATSRAATSSKALHKKGDPYLLKERIEPVVPPPQDGISFSGAVEILGDTTYSIIGGIPVNDPQQFPYFAFWSVGCGASLIAPDMLLTAAHCQEGYEDPISGRLVYLGSTGLKQGIKRRVVEMLVHPSYSTPTSLAYDMMLLKLNASATHYWIHNEAGEGWSRLSNRLSLAPLNPNYVRPQSGDELMVVGFGSTSNTGNLVPHLQHANVTKLDDKACADAYGGAYHQPSMICAGNVGRDSCQGDSGGPIVNNDGVQVGIVSWGIGCAQPDNPGVYSRISAARWWINDIVCRKSCYPPTWCDVSIRHQCSFASKTPRAPPSGPLSLTITLTTDYYPQEVGAILRHMESDYEYLFQGYNSQPFVRDGRLVFEHNLTHLPPGEIYFGVFDQGSDGLCCSWGAGNIQVTDANNGEVILKSDGNYRSRTEWIMKIDEHGQVVSIDHTSRGSESEEPEIVDNGWPFNPETDDPNFPGAYARTDSELVINVRYDLYPEETTVQWQELSLDGSVLAIDAWETVDVRSSSTGASLLDQEITSYTQQTNASSLYRLRITDTLHDGTCCFFGNGYSTITDTSAVLWHGRGDFGVMQEAYVFVNEQGMAKSVVPVHIPGVGDLVVLERDSDESSGGSATAILVNQEA